MPTYKDIDSDLTKSQLLIKDAITGVADISTGFFGSIFGASSSKK